MLPYPAEIVSRPNKACVKPDEDSLFIRAVNNITSDDVQDNQLVPKFVDKILEPNGNREVFSLSVYLDGEYKGEYVRFWPTNEYALRYWDSKEDVDVKKIEYSEKEKSPVYIRYAMADGDFPIITVTSQKTFSKTYACKFIYRPTNCNFWHYELKVFENGKETALKYKGNTETKNIAQKIAEDLLLFVDEEKTIPLELRS